MRYFLALFLPPLAIISLGLKPLTLIVNIILTICGILPGIIHAVLMVNKHYGDKKHKELLQAVKS